jgi:hypothetical protein
MPTMKKNGERQKDENANKEYKIITNNSRVLKMCIEHIGCVRLDMKFFSLSNKGHQELKP